MRPLPGRSTVALWIVAVVAIWLASAAFAQGGAWTVQTVALRDLRQADTVVSQLRNLGFDAYDEFAMNDGKQFVRVRVGCYADRAAAQAAATALAKHVTEQAVPAPISPGARVDHCVREEIGFLKPASWSTIASGDKLPTFHVRVAGHSADLVFDGARWVVVQDGSPRPKVAVSDSAAFVTAHPGDVAWAAEETLNGTRLLCPGTLVGHAGKAAVVERAGEVVACSFAPPSLRVADGGSP